MDISEDQGYIDKIIAGDSGSYEFLVDKYKYMAYTIAIKILGNAEDAEDVGQESFIKAYQQLHQFKGKSKFSTWLYTIVYRTAVSRLRENRVDTFSIDDRITENHTNDRIAPQLEQLHLDEQQKHIHQAVQKLPKTEALLITLFYLNENSVREIQEITGLTTTNIKIKLFRARKRLERELSFLMQDADKK